MIQTVDLVFSGLKQPTSMIFLGPNDVLVAQKNEGTVERIVNGVKNTEPLVTVPVASKDERGLLGTAISKDPISKKTQSSKIGRKQKVTVKRFKLLHKVELVKATLKVN